MLHNTRGIVFHSVRYAESSLVVKIYTSAFGLQSYLVRGVHRRGSKFRPALLQPMTLLDMVVYHKERHSLQSVKEMRIALPYRNIPFDILKGSVSVFVNELLYTAIREEEPHPALFDFIWNSMAALDDTDGSVAMFPLQFMTRLMHYTGCFPQCNHSAQTPFFDLREGCYQATVPAHPQYLRNEESEWLSRLLALARDESGPILPRSGEGTVPLNAMQRSHLLGILMIYYRLHLPWFRELQSHHVLRDVLS